LIFRQWLFANRSTVVFDELIIIETTNLVAVGRTNKSNTRTRINNTTYSHFKSAMTLEAFDYNNNIDNIFKRTV